MDAMDGSQDARSDSLVSMHTPEASTNGKREHECNDAMVSCRDFGAADADTPPLSDGCHGRDSARWFQPVAHKKGGTLP
jgi:hypothetical protein